MSYNYFGQSSHQFNAGTGAPSCPTKLRLTIFNRQFDNFFKGAQLQEQNYINFVLLRDKFGPTVEVWEAIMLNS